MSSLMTGDSYEFNLKFILISHEVYDRNFIYVNFSYVLRILLLYKFHVELTCNRLDCVVLHERT